MNAQEAIERMEKQSIKIKWIMENHPEGLKISEDLKRELDALSIVLESAKLFHEKALPEMINANLRFGRTEEYTTIYGVPLEKVGIVIEVDE